MKVFFVLVIAFSLTGCANFATGRYSISTDNAVALRSLSGTQINVGSFTDKENISEIACHYHGPVTTLDGETFASFIQKAFTDELKMAGIYSKTAPVTITGRLDRIDYSTAFASEWELMLTLYASTGKSVTVSENYKYTGSVFAAPGGECVQAALAFVPAVQNLIGKIIEQLPALNVSKPN
ncbi:MAG: hypothetical protein PHD01_15080 [Geobacteraceae bacterium]|nr:hypothetical protein [Geobacteraceae bacterium]